MQLVSVIVPIYNVEQYLPRCIESILAQTYKNFELILVDDGSPDKCPEICEKYAEKDNRISVIHKINGGLSDARNAGLDIAKGDFITFVDSDDMIAPNAIEILLNAFKESNADIVITTRYNVFSEQNKICLTANSGDLRIVNPNEAEKTIFCENTRWEAWGTLYKAELFENEEFPVGKLYEDLALVPLIVLKANKVCFADTAIYYYFRRTDSIMADSKVRVKIDLLEICKMLIDKMNHTIENSQMLADINAGILSELSLRVELAENNISVNKDFIYQSRKFIRKNSKFIVKTKMYCFKQKLHYLLISFGMGNLWKKAFSFKAKFRR